VGKAQGAARAVEPTLRPTPSLSAEIFIVPLDGKSYLIHAPLRRAAFVANAKTVNFLADLQDGVLDAAADPDGSLIELLRRLEIVDGGLETWPLVRIRGKPEPTSLTLFLTTACNLRCSYCYAMAGEKPVRSMGLDTARRGIDFVAANTARKGLPSFEIIYHGGGEPTLNWRTLTGSLDYARERAAALGLEVRASAATNGVLSDRKIDWIVGNLQGVSLSFDGLPEAHDAHRVTASGKGSSGRVMHTMRRFEQVGFPYGLRMTIPADQIPSLPDSVEFVCSSFRPTRIQIEPAYRMGRYEGGASTETQEFIAAFRAARERAASHGQEISFSGARVETLTSHFCGATQDGFCLTPDGNVTSCYEAFSEDDTWSHVFFYGSPDANGGYRFDRRRLARLRGQSVDRREYCRGCFARWSCAGDCFYKSLATTGKIEFGGSDRCTIIRELTKDQILARIAASGGLFWHEPAPAETEAVSETLPPQRGCSCEPCEA
jgi:uncharacterized protein